MASLLQFSDNVMRYGIIQAMGNEEFSSEVLVEGRFLKREKFDNKVVSNTINYSVDLPPGQVWHNTFGYEAGTGTNRLGRETDTESIFALPLQYFATDDEQELWKRRGEFRAMPTAISAMSTKMAQQVMDYRRRVTVHDFVRRVKASAGGGARGNYQSMVIDRAGTASGDSPLTVDIAEDLLMRFPGDYLSRLEGWLVHHDVYWPLRRAARKTDYTGVKDEALVFVPVPGTAKGTLYLHGLPVYMNNDTDATVVQDGGNVTVYGTKYIDTVPNPDETRYRTLLIAKQVLTEKWEIGSTFKVVEKENIPAGTPGWPAGGMSSGTIVLGRYYRSGIIELPSQYADRMLLGLIEHNAPGTAAIA